MPKATSPPPLPADLTDGLLGGLRRVVAVADLVACVPPERLLEGTLPEVGKLIGTEAARMLALVRAHESGPNHQPTD